jgi:hypothetical protein
VPQLRRTKETTTVPALSEHINPRKKQKKKYKGVFSLRKFLALATVAFSFVFFN